MDNNIEPDKVYVLNKNEVLIAVFDKDDEEPIINPQIEKTQNAESVFTFNISANNSKWEQIKDPENLYVVDGKIYSTNFEGCFTEVLSENNDDLIQVIAYERQKLLSRKFVRAWNSETGFESIDTFMVVVLSNGDLPLKNNGNLVTTSHEKGTSGYVLDALLYGTGWVTGTCDVEGTFDFETDQVDIYENILKVQEIWGGILVFDSVNKIVHHRDESTWLPYNGYEVKYQKNMQSLEKVSNNRIITKLCPLGEGGLNIKSVNSGSEWLTNYSYTQTTLEGIENNPDIYEPSQLKRWGERKLQELCKPRIELTVQAALLYQVEGYELERVDLNDVVDVINYSSVTSNADAPSEVVQLRVVKFTYKLWDYADAVLELSDITLESTDIFKKNVQAANQVNDGTINTTQVVSYFRSGETVEKSIRDTKEAIAEIEVNEDNIVISVKGGGLNLLKGTTDKEWQEITVTATEGRSAAMIENTDIDDLELVVGDKIAYSLDIKTETGKKLRPRISYYDDEMTPILPWDYADEELVIQDGIGHSYVTGTIPQGCKYIGLWVDASLTSETITGTTTEYVKSEKLEKGHIPTDWTPAIGDYSTSAEIQVELDSITSRVEKLEDFTREITETNDIHLTDTIAGDGYIVNFVIYGNTQNFVYLSPSDTLTPSNTLVPLGDHFTLVIDTRSRVQGESPSAIELDVQLAEPIRNIGDVCDELRVTDFVVSVYRRIGVDANNQLYVLTTPTTEVIGTLKLPTFDNNTYLYVKEYTGLKYYAKYITSNEYSQYFTTKVQLSTTISETEKEILLLAQQKMDTQTAEALFSVMADRITTKVSKNELSSEISQSADAIDIRGNRITIKSDFFELTADGRIKAVSGNIAGFEISSNNFSKNIDSVYDYDFFDALVSLLYLNGVIDFQYDTNMLNLLDANSDGIINIFDTITVLNIAEKKIVSKKEVTGNMEINTNNPKNCITIKDSNGKVITSIGLGGVNSLDGIFQNIICSRINGNEDNYFIVIDGVNGQMTFAYGSNTGTTIKYDEITFQNGINYSNSIKVDEILMRKSSVSQTSVKPEGIVTPVVTQTSREEDKKDFTKLENALDIINGIDIYKYHLKSEEDTDKKHIGFVIGDKFKYKEEVTSKDNDGVDIYSFISVCCQAIKEQQAEIEELKNEINKLKGGK